MPCEHKNWRVFGLDEIGYGRCLDCNTLMPISDLINGDHERCKAILLAFADLESRVKALLP